MNTVQPKELWETAYLWLKQCGINVHKSYCKEEITTHPDYPALISVIDFLESGGMSYHAVKANAEYIDEFNYPVLAHTQLGGQDGIHLVPYMKYWDEQPEITQNWSGIVVVPAEEASTWSTEGNTAYLRAEHKKTAFASALALIGLAVFAATIYLAPNLLLNAFGLLSIAGILVSVLLLANELGFQSQIVKQVCGAFSESGCERVMKSSYGKGFGGITPADASLLYFTTQFTLYVAACLGNSFLLPGILTLALAGIAVMAWSLYTQAVKLRVWCALCLAAVAILGGQAVLAGLLRPELANEVSLGAFALVGALLALLFLPVKGLIKDDMANRIKLAELKKWKSDGTLFVSQWQKEQAVDNTLWQDDLITGSAHAPLRITVACNLFCNPCAKRHKELDNLVERYGEQVCVQVRLLAPAYSEKMTQATVAVLQKAAEGLPNDTMKAMLSSWFDKMNLQQWTQEWQPDTTQDVQQKLEQHRQWTTQSEIVSTPTLFLNGRKIPGKYSLEDIEHLVPQLLALLPAKSKAAPVYQ
jgi:uncharacterized membrane protein/predicted DsbA family dithiol-disulfide isomerase